MTPLVTLHRYSYSRRRALHLQRLAARMSAKAREDRAAGVCVHMLQVYEGRAQHLYRQARAWSRSMIRAQGAVL